MTIRDMIMMATGHDHFILQGYSAVDDKPVRDAIEMMIGFNMHWNLMYLIDQVHTGNIIISVLIWLQLSFKKEQENV